MTTETKLIRFDWAIKSLLRDKANFDVLEGFLTALLREDIQVIQILDSESNQPEIDKKFNRVDILVKDQKQQQIIIEIQNHQETGYLERILWGVSKLIVDNLELGQDYRHISKVISISILYFNFGIGDDYVYRNVNEIRGLHTKKELVSRRLNRETKKFEKRYSKDIFPDFYFITVERFQDVIKSDLDEWIYMLKHSALRSDFKSKNIDRARDKLMLLKMSREERKRYENYIEDIVVENDVIETAQIQARLEIAQKMLDQGMDIETIASLTDLSVDVIKSASPK